MPEWSDNTVYITHLDPLYHDWPLHSRFYQLLNRWLDEFIPPFFQSVVHACRVHIVSSFHSYRVAISIIFISICEPQLQRPSRPSTPKTASRRLQRLHLQRQHLASRSGRVLLQRYLQTEERAVQAISQTRAIISPLVVALKDRNSIWGNRFVRPEPVVITSAHAHTANAGQLCGLPDNARRWNCDNFGPNEILGGLHRVIKWTGEWGHEIRNRCGQKWLRGRLMRNRQENSVDSCLVSNVDSSVDSCLVSNVDSSVDRLLSTLLTKVTAREICRCEIAVWSLWTVGSSVNGIVEQ